MRRVQHLVDYSQYPFSDSHLQWVTFIHIAVILSIPVGQYCALLFIFF